jgi:hypothetical protein
MSVINELLAPLDDAVDDPLNDPSRAELSALTKTILSAAKKVAEEAQAKALV